VRVGVRVVFAALTAALLAVVVQTTAHSATATDWIVFAARPDTNTAQPQLYRIQTDGQGLTQITNTAQPAGQPAFAPDGKQLAYVRLGVGIFAASPDGSGEHKLTSGPRDSYPTWSPNGKQIAFIRVVGSDWRLHVMSSNGKGVRRLPDAPSAGRPSWSRDGRSIFMSSGGQLVKVDARTGRIQRRYSVALDIAVSQGAALSPNGKTLAYVQTRPPTGAPDCGESHCPAYALYLAPISTGHRHKVGDDTGAATWSPDGKQIAYVARGAITTDVVASGKKSRISAGTHVPQGDAPAWQP
jgi:Tol biopolymer transport system component